MLASKINSRCGQEIERVKKRNIKLQGLRSVAVFEASKGLLVILVGFGLLSLIHRDLQAVGEQVIHFLHLNPAHHYPKIFLDFLSGLKPANFLWLAGGALCYSALRFVEAFGLWFAKSWAEWLAIFSSAIYLPFELLEVYREVTWIRVSLTVLNLLILGYLIWIKQQEAQHPEFSMQKEI
jgi:uncharacterized membrane protein (DUF2068 family)